MMVPMTNRDWIKVGSPAVATMSLDGGRTARDRGVITKVTQRTIEMKLDDDGQVFRYDKFTLAEWEGGGQRWNPDRARQPHWPRLQSA